MTEKQRIAIKCIAMLIKQKRMAKGLSQEELAWQCKLSQTSICTIELAKGDIKVSNLLTIFKILQIDFCEINKFLYSN